MKFISFSGSGAGSIHDNQRNLSSGLGLSDPYPQRSERQGGKASNLHTFLKKHRLAPWRPSPGDGLGTASKVKSGPVAKHM